ncbi:MAG: aminotransferase class I/II-fold pyridoxal phosphate-dependent enzyme, partial [Myxococcota bacterium]|nr:aminotransferase class I/II-fold pyridoxal phosphate-dependent enzyme [Myxococcota bacterium]
CVVDGRERVMLGSCNYLGLATHPSVIEGARTALDAYGVGFAASHAHPLSKDAADGLERALAEFLDVEEAIAFPSGFMASLAVIPALLEPLVGPLPCRRGTGTVLCDQDHHASVLEGVKLASASRVTFRHNDLEDLERRLLGADRRGPRVVLVEGVQSADGELAPLAEVAELCRQNGAIFYVDDAHGIGVLGQRGGGTLQHLGLCGKADLVMGSFGHALGGAGSFLAGRRDLIRYLRIAGRASAVTFAMPAMMAGAMVRALQVAREGELLRRRVRRNYEVLRSGLEELGFRLLGDGVLPAALVSLGAEKLAIRFQQRLFEEGVLVTALHWPAVPKNTARIRVTPMVSHSDAHLAHALDAFATVGRELNLIA